MPKVQGTVRFFVQGAPVLLLAKKDISFNCEPMCLLKAELVSLHDIKKIQYTRNEWFMAISSKHLFFCFFFPHNIAGMVHGAN